MCNILFILERNIKVRAKEMIKNKQLSESIKKFKAQNILTSEQLDEITLNDIWKLQFTDQKTNDDLKILKQQFTNVKTDINIAST